MHATCGAPSRLHWNVEPASVEVNSKEALVDVDVDASGGPDVIVVSGGVVSPPPPELTLQVRVAGVASVLPAASVARTLNVWDPTDDPV